MCLAVPGKVEEIYEADGTRMGKVNFGGVVKKVCLAFVPELELGDYTIVHVGFALSRIDEASAKETLAEFEKMGLLEEESGRCASKYLARISRWREGRHIAKEIRRITTQPWAIMEVCGGQTHSIIRNGIDQLLPDGIELIHGPGCPVCVTPLDVIDKALAIAARPGSDLLLVRRHAPRARQPARICSRCKSRRRRCPDRLLAAGCGQVGPGESGPRSRLFRHRL